MEFLILHQLRRKVNKIYMGDKVVRFDFVKKRRLEPGEPDVEEFAKPEPVLDTEPHPQSSPDASIKRERSGVVPPEDRFDFERLIATLNGLAALREASGIARRPDRVMTRHAAAQMDGWTVGELWRAINQGNERDWAKQPSYYDAVIEELTRRGLLPTR